MDIAIAILLGALAGVIGFIPLFAAIRMSRRSTSVKTSHTAANGLLGVLVSLIIVVIELVLCSNVAHDLLLPFAFAELVALVLATSAYVLYKNVLASRKR